MISHKSIQQIIVNDTYRSTHKILITHNLQESSIRDFVMTIPDQYSVRGQNIECSNAVKLFT